MRIDLEVHGLDDLSVASARLEQVAGSLRGYTVASRQAAVGARLLGSVAKKPLPLPSADLAPRLEKIAMGLQNVAAGYELVRQAQAGVSFEVPAAPGKTARVFATGGTVSEAQHTGTRIPVGPEQRVARLGKALEEAKAGGDAAQVADTQAALTRALAQRDRQRNRVADDTVAQPLRSRIGRGPRETLEALQKELEDPNLSVARREDLLDREFRARRSVVLNTQRRQNEGESLSRPGLLELFGDLNDLLRDARSGNIGGLLGKSYMLLGGLNSEQRGVGGGVARAAQTAEDVAGGAAGQAAAAAGGAAAGGMLAQMVNRFKLTEFAGLGAASQAGSGGLLARLGFAAKPFAPLLAAAGTAAIALGGLVVGVSAVSDALKTAVETIGAARRAAVESGGSAGEVARANALGVAPGDLAALGNQLRDRLSLTGGDVYAMMAGSRAGIGPQMPVEMGGDPNNARIVVQAMEYLRVLGAEGRTREQLTEATRLGMVGYLDLINVSERVSAARLRDAAVSEAVASRYSQVTRDLSAEQLRLTENLNTLKTAFVGPWLQDFADAIGFVADTTRGATAFVNAFTVGVKTMAATLDPAGLLRTLDLVASTVRLLKGETGKTESPEQRRENALRENTAAMRENTEAAMKLAKGGFIGGGERARRSLTLEKVALQRALEAGALRSRAPVV